MKIVIFGLAITSSWGNGHATTFRALCRALAERGHRIVFFEKNYEWYASNRDLPDPGFCEVHIFEEWDQALPRARAELRDADVAMVGSYFPHGREALDLMLSSAAAVKTFYDIDTPVTVAKLRETGETDYLLASHIAGLDVYFSFTGGPILAEIEQRFGAPRALPLYCSFDPAGHHRVAPLPRFQCDLSYMGTYAPDRQPKIEELLSEPARRLPERRFLVAGPQYPRKVKWPKNVRRRNHLNPVHHAALYSSSRLVLNVTRRDMVMAGYSPSVRLFEAAACAATIASDNWPGLDAFFTPGEEILLPTSSDDMVRYITGYSDQELRRVGEAAQQRVLDEHTSAKRAEEFEQAVAEAVQSHSDSIAQPA
jgi:spore maturation protein CgeB